MKKGLILFLTVLFFPLISFATVPVTFTNGTVADATEVNQNFNYFENKFSLTSGHDHDGSNSKSVLKGEWQGTIVDEVYGGTGNSYYASGDFLYATSSTGLARLAKGNSGSIMYVDHNLSEPYWLTPGSSGDFLKTQGINANPIWDSIGINCVQAVGSASNFSTSSTEYILLEGMAISRSIEDSWVLVLFTGVFKNTDGNQEIFVILKIDGTNKTESERGVQLPANDKKCMLTTGWLEKLTAGTHSFSIMWRVAGGTGTAVELERTMQVFEIKGD